jgi:hypothetical protein
MRSALRKEQIFFVTGDLNCTQSSLIYIIITQVVLVVFVLRYYIFLLR